MPEQTITYEIRLRLDVANGELDTAGVLAQVKGALVQQDWCASEARCERLPTFVTVGRVRAAAQRARRTAREITTGNVKGERGHRWAIQLRELSQLVDEYRRENP